MGGGKGRQGIEREDTWTGVSKGLAGRIDKGY